MVSASSSASVAAHDEFISIISEVKSDSRTICTTLPIRNITSEKGS